MTDEALELIDLDIPQLGYTKFISSWLYRGTEGTFLMDPGPAYTIPILLKALDDKRVRDLDWVLLTHIHQDHAGGLGLLIKKYPNAKIICHEKGAKHIINPAKLLESSKIILGSVAQLYGKILPVPKNNIHVLEKIPFDSGIIVLPTPGHASHHQCYVFKNWFFAGELFGAHVPTDKGLYLRPATPHRFILEDYLKSMELIESHLKETVCFAHYGSAKNPKLILKTARRQLKLWVKIIEENKDEKNIDKIIKALLENDEVYAIYNEFEPNMKQREREFSINSINGIMKYLIK